MGLPPGDYRAASYKEIASSNAATRAAAEEERKKRLSETSIGIKSDYVVSSDVAGVEQKAIRGGIAENTYYSQTISPTQTQQLEQEARQPAPVSAATQVFQGRASVEDYKAGRVQAQRSALISGRLASYYATLGDRPQSIRDDTPYYTYSSGYRTNRKTYNLNTPYLNYDTIGNVPSNRASSSYLSNGLGFTKVSGFEKRVERLETTEKAFTSQPVFKSLERKASYLTLGQGVPLEERGFWGQTSESVVGGILKLPLAFPGSIYFGAQRVLATGEGLVKYPKETLKELGAGFGRLEKGSFSFLPGGTPINPEGATTLIFVAGGAAFGYSGFKNNAVTRFVIEKTYPNKFISQDLTGIQYVESNTIPASKGELLSFQNKPAKTIHVTTSDIFGKTLEILTTAKLDAGAGPFRSQNLLLNFYKSSPSRTTGTPRAYLGYAGIVADESTLSSSSRVIYGKPTIRLLLSDDYISPTPRGIKGLQSINAYQAATTGKTFVPAENIAGMSIEGQFITPSNYANIPTASRYGLKNTPGSIISKTGESQFTFYHKNLPNQWFGGKIIDQITGRNYYKLEIIPTKTSPVPGYSPKGYKTGSIKTIDIEAYNRSYGNIRYSRIPTSEVLSFSKSLSSPSRISKAYSFSSRTRSSSSPSRSASSLSSIIPSITSKSSSPSKPSKIYSSLSYPSKSSTPSRISNPSYPSKPSYPSRSIIPSFPSKPSYPSRPSKPNPPQYPPRYPPIAYFKLKMRSNQGIGDYKAIRVTKYTPSFGAIYFNIHGSYKKSALSKSGLDFRPITKGFRIEGYNVQRGVL